MLCTVGCCSCLGRSVSMTGTVEGSTPVRLANWVSGFAVERSLNSITVKCIIRLSWGFVSPHFKWIHQSLSYSQKPCFSASVWPKCPLTSRTICGGHLTRKDRVEHLDIFQRKIKLNQKLPFSWPWAQRRIKKHPTRWLASHALATCWADVKEKFKRLWPLCPQHTLSHAWCNAQYKDVELNAPSFPELTSL